MEMVSWFCSLLLALVLSSAPATAAVPQAVTNAIPTTHQIRMEKLNGPGGKCSATAIGPHALLTAAHCGGTMTHLTVDGAESSIAEVYGDSLDHVIFLLPDLTFNAVADVDLSATFEQGDRVFIIGNPGHFSKMLRFGYVAGFDDEGDSEDDLFRTLFGGRSEEKKPKPVPTKYSLKTYYDMNGFFGDSGSAIFNMDGKVVAIMSFLSGDISESYSQKYSGSYRMALTKEMIEKARNYTGK